MSKAMPYYAEELLNRVDAAVDFDGGLLAVRLHQAGIGLVDLRRTRFLIDETVHQGALFRSALFRRRAEQADRWAAHVMPAKGVWRRLCQAKRGDA